MVSPSTPSTPRIDTNAPRPVADGALYGGIGLKIEKRLLLLFLGAILGLAVAPAGAACPLPNAADCIYVDDDCPTPPGTGAELDPFCTIQDAYDAFATPGSLITILVMPGTYAECVVAGDFDSTGNLSLAYMDKPVHLIADAWLEAGMPDPDPLDLSTFEAVVGDTTITGFGLCDGLGNSRAATVSIAGRDAKLEGFAITAGGASGVNARGGVDVSHNLVFSNEGELGGGINLRTETCALSVGEVNPIVLTSSIAFNVVRNNLADDFTEFGAGDGGGIFALADGFEQSFLCATVGGRADVTIANNFLMQNTAQNLFIDFVFNDTFAAGGGLAVETLTGSNFPPVTPLTDWQVQVRIAGNTVAGNTVVAGDGFAFGAGISTASGGSGLETVTIENNTVGPNNIGSSALLLAFGGGISASTVPVFFCAHEVTIDGNTILQNTADIGGGLDMLIFPQDLQANQRLVVTASSNSIENNTARNEAGGLNTEFNSERSLDVGDADFFTPAPIDFLSEEISVTIRNNTLRNNTSEGVGAGAVLRPDANADPDSGPAPPQCAEQRPATALIDFTGNVVEGNAAQGTVAFGTGDHPGGPGCSDPTCETAICGADTFCCNVEWDAVCFEAAAAEPACDCDTSDCCGATVVGGGILVFATAKGESLAGVSVNNSTIVGNTIAGGSVGGTEVAVVTEADCPVAQIGATALTIDRSIIAGNGGFGDGGPDPGLSDLTPTVTNSFLFDNGISGSAGQYQSTLFPQDPPGNFTDDPLLDPATFVPDLCSPVYDVPGFCENDPAAGCLADDDCVAPGDSCVASGAGFLASPDINHDDAVDGVDLLRFSTGFGAADDVDLRYRRGADLDRNGTIDGIDLMFIAPLFAQECVQ